MSRSELAVADVFFALGDRTRLSVVTKLGAGARTATTLAEGARVTRQAIVKHLQVLEGAGLVTSEKRGREVLYLLETKKLEEARDFIDEVSMKWDEALERLRDLVEERSPSGHLLPSERGTTPRSLASPARSRPARRR